MPGITKMPGIFYNSAMPLKQINQAENQLVVGGIKVLGSLEGPGVTSIKQNINSLSTSVQTVGQKQQDYFSSIADDTIITPGEKKTLKKEWNTIQQTYASIIELAKERDLDDTVNFINLKTRYNELYAYLFTELKVFDNMSENTTIPNTRTFTETYNNYYGQELICQNLLASESGTLVVRQLESLDSPGSPNEIAIHKGQLYRYNDTAAKWEYISTGNYVGILASVPDPIMDNYFLAGVDIVLNHAIKVNGKVLRSSKNKIFQIKKTYKKGLIYIYNENGWTPILDKNDYRYIIATNDLLKIGEDVSPGLESIARQPKYFSTCNTLPEDYKNKDFFVYSGDTKTIQYGDGQETLFIHGELYQFNAPTWTKLESSDPANNQQFMTALTDLLIVHEATEGYFTSVLVKNLIANEAFIKSLATQIITLSQDPNNPGKTGIIQSDNFVPGEKGFRLKHNGESEFINISAIGGSFLNGFFSGLLDCEVFKISKQTERALLDSFIKTDTSSLERTNLAIYLESIFKNEIASGDLLEKEGTIESIFGKDTYITDGEVIYTKYKYNQDLLTRLPSYGFFIAEENGEYIYLGGMTSTGVASFYSISKSVGLYKNADTQANIFIYALPPSDPLTKGQVWSDNGTLKISKGIL